MPYIFKWGIILIVELWGWIFPTLSKMLFVSLFEFLLFILIIMYTPYDNIIFLLINRNRIIWFYLMHCVSSLPSICYVQCYTIRNNIAFIAQHHVEHYPEVSVNDISREYKTWQHFSEVGRISSLIFFTLMIPSHERFLSQFIFNFLLILLEELGLRRI